MFVSYSHLLNLEELLVFCKPVMKLGKVWDEDGDDDEYELGRDGHLQLVLEAVIDNFLHHHQEQDWEYGDDHLSGVGLGDVLADAVPLQGNLKITTNTGELDS